MKMKYNKLWTVWLKSNTGARTRIYKYWQFLKPRVLFPTIRDRKLRLFSFCQILKRNSGPGEIGGTEV